jgi:peptidoglycan-associated lipoprotein
MRHLAVIGLIILGIIINVSCAPQKKIVQAPEQSSEKLAVTQPQPETKLEDKQKIATADTITTKELPKESITEKQLTKAQPTDIQPSLRELQTRIQDIHFDYDRYDIRDDAKPVLKEVSAILSRNKNIKAIIEGHCDERGTNEYNLGLGDRRANSAKEFLISLGIPSNKIETISYGEERPLCENQTEECWAKNRRAHFVLVEGGK